MNFAIALAGAFAGSLFGSICGIALMSRFGHLFGLHPAGGGGPGAPK